MKRTPQAIHLCRFCETCGYSMPLNAKGTRCTDCKKAQAMQEGR
ncbi:MAG: hypothetical protein ACREF4_06225 [Gammaproteobacteria bacterium]